VAAVQRLVQYSGSDGLLYKTRLLWPVPGLPPGSPFGPRWGRYHHGVDIPAPEGAPIFAAHAGKVQFAGTRGAYGKLIILIGKGKASRYAHALRVFVEEGDTVQQGDLIAQVGSTGNASGPHLHFEVRITTPDEQWATVDPVLFFTSRWLLADAAAITQSQRTAALKRTQRKI
jgi:murein DD-endopeptidase MepM/ murein hydrolase activator NlpD